MQTSTNPARFPSSIDLICYDFDGVMTNNRVLVLEDGTEAVFVNRGDGWAIGEIKKAGIPQVIFSTETNPVVSTRGQKLNIPVLQGLDDKAHSLKAYAIENRYSLEKIIYIGNDLNDIGAMNIVGCPIAPADSHSLILDLAAVVTKSQGGAGVIRELYDILIEGGHL